MTDTTEQAAFELKGGLFTLTSLLLEKLDTQAIEAQIIDMIAQSPKFFENAPIVLDLQHVAGIPLDIPFKEIRNLLQKHGLVPVGIKGGSTKIHRAAADAGLAILSVPKKKPIAEETSTTPETAVPSQQAAAPEAARKTKVITQPVRSGQQIYAKGGDLIVIAPVSRGAEIVADGHIHVYGPLRGRALAGAQGDESAQIFCQSLDAELVSIAGIYTQHDNIQKQRNGELIRVRIKEGKLTCDSLS